MKQDNSNTGKQELKVGGTASSGYYNPNVITNKEGHWIAKTITNSYNSEEQAKVNAERIVKAWNEYDQLQEENKALISQLAKTGELLNSANAKNKELREALQKIDAKSFHKNEWVEMAEINKIATEALKNNTNQ